MSAPAVPGGDLFPDQACPVEDVIAGLTAVYGVDPERADGLRRSVIVESLEWIRDGHPDPQGIASHALRVMNTRFPRCYPSAAGEDEADAIRDLKAQYPAGAQRLWEAIDEEGDVA